MQEACTLPLEDINARQMIEEASILLKKLDRALPPPPAHLMDTTFVVAAMEHIDDEGERLVLGTVVDPSHAQNSDAQRGECAAAHDERGVEERTSSKLVERGSA